MAKNRTHWEKSVSQDTEWRKLGGEFVGTFVLTATAAGADVVDFLSGGEIGHVARYVAPGIAVTAMIWSLSGLSGAHINPAVTFAFALRRSFPWRRVPGYLCAQFAGAIAAAWMLRALFGTAVKHGVTKPHPPFSPLTACVSETFLSFFLVFTILATADQKAIVGKNAALAVGGIVALCGLAFSPVSGASMNPARSIGPMIAALTFTNLWIYLCGPLIGAAIAVATVSTLFGPPTDSDREAADGKSS